MKQDIRNQSTMNAQQENTVRKIENQAEAEALCTELLKSTGALIATLERETGLLRKANSDELSALTLKKQALSSAIARDMTILKHNAGFIRSSAPEQISQLKEQDKQFRRSLDSNHHALQAMKAVSEQLLRTVAKKAGNHSSGSQVYGSNATMATGPAGQTGAISVDTTL